MEQQSLTYKKKTGEIKVTKINDCEYEAMSESGDDKRYRIVFVLGRRFCGCQGFCAHMSGLQSHCRNEKAVPPLVASGPRAQEAQKEAHRHARDQVPRWRSTKFKESHMRPNKLCKVQVFRCLSKKCGRYFTPDDGFLGRTYRVVMSN